MAAAASIYRQPNPLLRGAFPLLALFLFAIYSAFMEVLPFVGALRPQLILAILGLLVVFGTGQFAKIVSSRIGMCFVAFTAWFIACVPFGAWPGGSAHVFLEQWYKAFLIYFMAAGLLTTLPQADRLFRVIAYAAGVLGVLTFLKNDRSADGRLILDNTRYANSNDLAWTLLVGLTFVGFMFLRGGRAQKAIALLMVPPILLTISRTGSRAGAMGAVLLFFLIVFQSKPSTRIRILAVSPVIFLTILMLMPAGMRMRYTTFFGETNTYDVSAAGKLRLGTIESTEARKQLLYDSLNITAHHPFLGVGPGNFDVAQADLAAARGDARGIWHLTHNTYTQLSSEMGIPGLAIYVAMLYYVFKTLNAIVRAKARSTAWNDLRALAISLRTAFIVFIPIAFFDALAYNADVPILAGIATALGFMAQKQRAIDRAAETQAHVEALTPADSALEPAAVGQY
jgi:O-antigen ligase